MTGNLTLRRPGVWKFSYSIDGKRGYATIEASNRRLAEREAAKLYAKALDTAAAAQPKNWTVAKLLDAWLKDHLPELGSDFSRRNYRDTVQRFWVPQIGDIPLARYSSQHLLAIKQDMVASGLASRTVEARWAILRQAEAWAVKHDYLSKSPAALVEVPPGVSKPTERYSLAQAMALDAVLQPPWGIVIALGLHAGLRIGEARAVRLVDVDSFANVLHVRQQLVRLPGEKGKLRLPKMSKTRTVVITPLLEAHIEATRDWHDEHQHTDGKIRPLGPGDFLGCRHADHEAFHPDTVYERLRWAQEAAGVPQLKFHALRHTCATLAREAGIPDVNIAAMLGHANTNMLVRLYGAHPSEDRHAGMREKMAAYMASASTLPGTLPSKRGAG